MNEDELKLLPNDVITNVVIVEEGWCEGNLNGRRGMFPSNFVSIIAEEDEPMEAVANKNGSSTSSHTTVNKIDPTASSSISNAPTTTPSSVQPKPLKLPGAVGFGVDIFKDAKPLRKRELGPMKSTEVKNDTSQLELMKKRNSLKKSNISTEDLAVPLKPTKIVEEPTKPPPHPIVEQKEKAKVVYDYQPENTDELELKEGDIVMVLDKESVDSGWWYGECNGKKGVFPDNFVVTIPQEPERPKKDSIPLRPPDSVVPPMSPLKPPVKSDELSKSGPVRPLKPTAQRKPPPIKNKPAAASKSVPALPTAAKEPEKKTVSISHSSELQFDDIKPNNKLNHPNLSRPKTPSKRPPSVYKNPDGLTEELASLTSNNLTVPKPKTATVTPTQPEKPSQEPAHKEREASRNHDSTPDNSNEELKNEIKSLKETIKEMKDMMTNLRADMKKEMNSLMEEVDEEKRLRMNMQIQLDRMKKLIQDKN